MATSTESRLRTDSLGTLDWIGVVLAVLLGIAYLPLGIGELPESIGIAFVLAGFGYFGAVVLVLLDLRRRLLYAVGIGYNALLIVLYVVIQQPALGDLAGFAGAVKAGQVVFIVLLVALLRR